MNYFGGNTDYHQTSREFSTGNVEDNDCQTLTTTKQLTFQIHLLRLKTVLQNIYCIITQQLIQNISTFVRKMFNLSFSIFLITFLYYLKIISSESTDENWIDPYDMSPSKDYLQFSDSISSMHAHFLNENNNNPTNSLTDIYFKRTINMLLNTARRDYTDYERYSGHLFFKLTSEEYDFLKKFTEGSETNLEKLDKILVNILTKPSHEFLQEYLESWFHKCLNVILSREGTILIIIITYIFVIIKLFHTNLYSWQLLKFLLINFFIFDFIFTWVHLYQKAQAKDLVEKLRHQNVPAECNPELMNSWEFVTSIFAKEDACVKYYEVQFSDIFYKISPGVVLTEMFARTVQYPAKQIGQGFGELCYGIYGTFPWPLNIIILPVCLIFLSLMTCIIFIFVLSIFSTKRVKLNFFHLISFSFGGESAQNIHQDTISGQNLERLLNITQNSRTRIQEIPVEKISSEKNSGDLKRIEETKKEENIEIKKDSAKKVESIRENTDKSRENSDSLNKDESFEKVDYKTEIGAGDFE